MAKVEDYPKSFESDFPTQIEKQDLTPTAKNAIQGISETQAQSYEKPIRMDIKASDLQPQTIDALHQQGLESGDVILADNRGKKAEAAASTILSSEGLPEGNYERTKLQNITPGHYDQNGHGIDLVGVTPKGEPIPIECKKRQDPKSDSLGADSIAGQNLEPETLALQDEILRERQVNPAKRLTSENLGKNVPDSELSLDQMGGLWTRDRWLKLVKDESNCNRLRQAGVSEEYLDLDNLRNPYSKQWQDILDRRTSMIITTDKENVSDKLYSQALFERGCNVAVINLKS